MEVWKENLRAVGDNPDYIELNIKAIQDELRKHAPDTGYLLQKAHNIETWIGEIELARKRAKEKRSE